MGLFLCCITLLLKLSTYIYLKININVITTINNKYLNPLKKIQLDKAYINILLVKDAIYYQYLVKYGLKHRDITTLLAISKVTSSNLGACTITELRKYLSGICHRDCYLHIKLLTDKGYIISPSAHKKSKKSILLTDLGNQLLKKFHRSIYNRVQKLNDQLKLSAKSIREVPQKVINNRAWQRNNNAKLKGLLTIQT